MSHPDGLPDLFLDRSLGRIKVPHLLRTAGLRLVTLAEHYGIPADEAVADTDWLRVAGEHGWAVLMKDARIRYRHVERRAVIDSQVKCFCLTSQSLRAEDMASRFLDNLAAITEQCQDPGPCIFAVHTNRIERLRVDPG